MNYKPVLEVTRGEIVESVHYGAVAVTDTSGKLNAWLGDPEVVTFLRSSAKPFQGLPLLESGAAAHYGLSSEQIAVICSSHSGTDEHVREVASIQSMVGVTEDDLLCGVHPPFHNATAERLKQEGFEPTPNHHNCSGKHTGMLALARFLDAPSKTYVDPNHLVQRRNLQIFAELCGLEPEAVEVGIDGCSAPNFAVPLRAAATAFARLADPSGLTPERAEACNMVVTAMTSHPLMVAGPDRFDTRLMEVTSGRLIAKGGAEGYQGVGILSGAIAPDSKALGVAIKIADGDCKHRARAPVTLAVLEAIGALGDKQREALVEFGPQPVLNHLGLEVGRLRTCFHLECML
jgi:L-asparaginase II